MNCLLDTNVCIHYLKNEFGLGNRLRQIGFEQCAISELTVLELLYGAAGSSPRHQAGNRQRVEILELLFTDRVFPIRPAFEAFAEQKARLRRTGRLISDFDLLIGCTALVHNLTLVTRNVREMERIEGLRLENWIA